MYLIESEIRKIVRKNLIKYYQDQLLNEQVLSSGTNLKFLTLEKEIDGKKIKVPTLQFQGVQGVLIGTDNDDFEFFIPSTYIKDKTGDILYRENNKENFKNPDEEDLKLVKSFIENESKEDTIKDKFDPNKNQITSDFKSFIESGAANIWKVVTDDGGKEFIRLLRAETESTWGDINKYRVRMGQPEIGLLFESTISPKSVNISVDLPAGKPSIGKVIDDIIEKAQEFKGKEGSGFLKRAGQAIASSLSDDKMTSNEAGELFRLITRGRDAYSYYHLNILAKSFKKTKGEDLWKFMQRQKDGQMYKSGMFKTVMLDNKTLGEVPLFHLIPESGGSPLPVYATGKAGYENIRKAMLENYSKTIGQNKKTGPAPTPGKEIKGQTPKKAKEKEVDYSSGVTGKDTSASGGIRMSVSSDSDNTIKGFDDLGFKAGTDAYIRKELRRLVKSERKFRGTGVINLEILFNKFGRVSNVRFRKGQGKLAARQVERLRSRIKEILGNAKYEEYRSRDDWYQNSGVKNRMDQRGQGGRKGSKVNMIVKMF